MRKHLTLSDRKSIEKCLSQGVSFAEIGRRLEVASCSISREVRRHLVQWEKGGWGRCMNDCVHRKSCFQYDLCGASPACSKKCSTCPRCNSVCPEFEAEECSRLCNGCRERRGCTLKKRLYQARNAEDEYTGVLHEARRGFNLCSEELKAIDEFFSKGILQGQSVSHIIASQRNRAPCSESTARRLIHAGAIAVRDLDMIRVCKMKPRRGEKRGVKVDTKCRKGRTYEDFQEFRFRHPDAAVVEVDSVIGKRGGKVLLTMMLRNCNFMLAFLRNGNTSASVEDWFSWLFSQLGEVLYRRMFQVLLADNGMEFSDPRALEFDPKGERRSWVFYCHPGAPYQKGKVENNHGLLRRVCPKGTSFDGLTQKDVDLMMSHVNSYGREIFNGVSPAQLFVSMYGTAALRLIGQRIIPPEEITLRPSLIFRN